MSEYSAKNLELIFGKDFVNYLSQLNVLMIGVGGIGCELLKALSPFKFNNIEILDLDKIEVSNLNRQFLFRNQHVGNSKAHVAKETVTHMFPHMKINSHHANIFDPEYAIHFFKQFNIVFMALDNAEARSYVNKLCMILDLPLLEAGTTGHKGQAMLIKKGLSRCYSCFPKPKPKSYPVCTIRTLPEKPIHCIIWAKHLFNLLFGPQDKENPLIDLIDSLTSSEQDDKKLAVGVFNEMFYNQVIKMKDLEPEKFSYITPVKLEEDHIHFNSEFSSKKISNQVEDIKNYLQIFIDGYRQLRVTKDKEGPIMFDKDDNLALKFVSAISNIRAHVFNIPLESEFNIKEMAGNIVPTIASTNAIVAAIQVTEAIKFLQSQFLAQKNQPNTHIKNKELYVQNTRTTKVLEASLGQENPNCLICNDNFLPHLVFTNFQNTLKEFLQHLQEKDSNLKEYTITTTKGDEIYEISEDLDEDDVARNENNASKTLAHWFGSHQGEIVLNDNNSGAVEKYLLSHDETALLKVFNFTKRERVAGKPSQLTEQMISNMLDDKAKQIAVDKVKAYNKAREDDDIIEEEIDNKASAGKEGANGNNGMILLEDDEDEIVFEDPKAKNGNGNQELLGKRLLEGTEEGNQAEIGPEKKLKTANAGNANEAIELD